MGAKKRPVYAVVAADHRFPRDGRYIEKLGNYAPLLSKENAERFVIKEDRVKYWLSQGAKPTTRIAHLLSQSGIGSAPKAPERTKKHLPKAKAQQRIQEREEARKNAAEAIESKPAE